MNITDDARQYFSKIGSIENYHMNIYQLIISSDIEKKFIEHAQKIDISDVVFKNMMYNYKYRVKSMCMITEDWKDNYTKIMYRAYKQTIEKYS